MAGRDKLYWIRQTPALYRMLSEGSKRGREGAKNRRDSTRERG